MQTKKVRDDLANYDLLIRVTLLQKKINSCFSYFVNVSRTYRSKCVQRE